MARLKRITGLVKSLPVFIGWRYFSAGSRSRLGSFISLLAIAGLTLGITLLIVVLSIMNGFDNEMKTRILASVPHIRLIAQEGIPDWQSVQQKLTRHPNIVSVSPISELDGMLNFRGRVRPITVRGISPADDHVISRFISPELLRSLGSGELLVSQSVAGKIGLEKGDRVTLMMPNADKEPGRLSAPVVQVFSVKGFFATQTTLDQLLVVTSISSVNAILGMPADYPQSLQLQVHDLFNARETGYQLLRMLPSGYSFSDWLQTHGNLYQAIRMSRSMVSLLVFLIIGIAVFNVVSMLVMTVVEKRGAVAILKTLGASNSMIVRIFLFQGACIGVFGSLSGAVLGVLLSLNVTNIAQWLESLLGVRFINSEIYPIDYLPAHLLWQDVMIVIVVALLLNFLATIYPAWRAAKTGPAEVLRSE
ncbi:MAG: lipoprotein-releasing ABC transporter permease subunit [Porticoccaceae bacterium]|nr:lipoprotein-releasing ABC transporter permease subunit [Pseudomonadales bacterium]MCP5171559.1 lipoprotein-releasing ABC transporter permease subunit [Pseudomonadales bacterium]